MIFSFRDPPLLLLCSPGTLWAEVPMRPLGGRIYEVAPKDSYCQNGFPEWPNFCRVGVPFCENQPSYYVANSHPIRKSKSVSAGQRWAFSEHAYGDNGWRYCLLLHPIPEGEVWPQVHSCWPMNCILFLNHVDREENGKSVFLMLSWGQSIFWNFIWEQYCFMGLRLRLYKAWMFRGRKH